jgi:hypothetical protein
MKIATTTTPLELPSREGNFSSENADTLDSWKEIARYLNRNVRTVQRWEAFESMPVHRHFHAKSGSVHAFRSELDAWRKQRSYCGPSGCDQTRSQANLRAVLEAILVQLTAQAVSAMALAPDSRSQGEKS